MTCQILFLRVHIYKWTFTDWINMLFFFYFLFVVSTLCLPFGSLKLFYIDCLYKIAYSLISSVTSALVGCRYNQLHCRGLFGLPFTFLQISEARGGKSLRFRNFFTRRFAQTVLSTLIEKWKKIIWAHWSLLNPKCIQYQSY